MTQETLLRILFENGHEDIIALAVKIDAGIKETETEVIKCRISKHDLKEGTQFKKADYNGVVNCQVLSINPYKLKDKYLVLLPNGSSAMKSHYPDDKLSVIEDIPAPAESEKKEDEFAALDEN